MENRNQQACFIMILGMYRQGADNNREKAAFACSRSDRSSASGNSRGRKKFKLIPRLVEIKNNIGLFIMTGRSNDNDSHLLFFYIHYLI